MPHSMRVFLNDMPFDPDCMIGQLDWPELTNAQRQVCMDDGMVPIFDAETSLVALVPAANAEIMLEIINRFRCDSATLEEVERIDSVDRKDLSSYRR